MSRSITSIARNSAMVRAGEKYGIEVEAEGCPLETVPEMRWSPAYQAYWGVTSDGSLRNGGIEFLSKPLGRTAVRHAINGLWPYFAEGRMVPSVRTGIHIHASCLGLDTQHVLRILRHYALVEPALFAYVGAAREENIYCIPWYRSPEEAQRAFTWISGWEPNYNGPTEEEPCKYSALYVGPLSRFGTIEFRHAPTWTDADTMYRWWQMVQAIWKTHATDYDVLERYNELGPLGFCRSILPFDFLPELSERAFEDADVDVVCSLLQPPQMLVAEAWGQAPELRGRGMVVVSARRNFFDLDAPAPPNEFDRVVSEARDRARIRLNTQFLVQDEPPTLTVNAEENSDYDEDPYTDNDDEEREEF